MDESVHISKLLTEERFELGYSEVKKEIELLKLNKSFDKKQLEKIKDQDILLEIKYRTYKKCNRQLVIGLIMLGMGVGLVTHVALFYLLIVGGTILLISSFFGILSNKLTKAQRDYLKR